jgi:hypothetical protein
MTVRTQTRQPIWLAVVAAAAITVVWCPALSVAASPGKAAEYGAITVSGPIRETFAFNGLCVAFKMPELAATPTARTLAISVIVAVGTNPPALFTVTDEDLRTRGVAHVNLATTETFNAQLFNNRNNVAWEGGWWPGQARGERFTHYGTGKLTMSASGNSGTIAGTLSQVNGRKRMALTVSGSWACRKLTQA